MLLNSFYNYLEFEKRYSPHTLDAYKSDIGQYADFLQHIYQLQDIKESKPIHIRSWIVQLHDQKISNRSINRKISSLKTLFHFLRKRHGVEQNPLRKVINPKVEKRLPITVRKEHLQELLKVPQILQDELFQNNHFQAEQNNLIIDILYSCGLRRSELINLKIRDIDFSRQLMTVEGKGKKERQIPIARPLLTKLIQFLKSREKIITALETQDHGYVFITAKGDSLYPKYVYNLVRNNLSAVTTVERKSPHILRHSFATHLSDAGADLNAVKTLLGHASLAATQVYMHNTIEKLKKVYEQAHPKS